MAYCIWCILLFIYVIITFKDVKKSISSSKCEKYYKIIKAFVFGYILFLFALAIIMIVKAEL